MLWPEKDGDLSKLMFWSTMTHAQRWRHAHRLVGLGPLYQGRFKCFPTQTDDHFLTLCRYTDANALRARLVKRAEDWRWGGLAVARGGTSSPLATLLRPWPIERPADWLRWVNRPQPRAEVEAVRHHIRSGRPFGEGSWRQRATKLLGIDLAPRPRRRPPRQERDEKIAPVPVFSSRPSFLVLGQVLHRLLYGIDEAPRAVFAPVDQELRQLEYIIVHTRTAMDSAHVVRLRLI